MRINVINMSICVCVVLPSLLLPFAVRGAVRGAAFCLSFAVRLAVRGYLAALSLICVCLYH